MSLGRVLLVAALTWGMAGTSSASAQLLAGDESAAEAGPFAREWRWSILGYGVGRAGMEIVDLDGEGVPELVASGGIGTWGSPEYWYILRWNGSGYEQIWSSPHFETVLEGLTVVQADLDPQLEVVVVGGGSVTVYDGRSHAKQGSYTILVTEVRAIAAGDVDGDGQAELALIDDSDLFVFDLATGALEAMRFGFGGLDLALGQADADAPLEIAIANGPMVGSLLDGATLQVQWGRAAGLGDYLVMANLDDDPYDELVAAWRYTREIRAFDPQSGSNIWEALGSDAIDALSPGDVNGDGFVELLYGDEQSHGIHVLDPASGTEEWTVSNPESGVTRIAVGDLDLDGAPEVAWGGGIHTTGPDHLFIADGGTHLLEWQSRELWDGFRALAVTDLEVDGEPELVAGARDSWLNQNLFVTLDLRQEREVNDGPRSLDVEVNGLRSVRAANLDSDPQPELCQAAVGSYPEGIACFDGRSGELQWQYFLPDSQLAASLQIADLDGDGSPEVLMGTSSRSGQLPFDHVYCLEGESGVLRWRTPDLEPGELSLLDAGNVDLDASWEVIVANRGGRLYVLDSQSGLVEYGPFLMSLSSLAVATRPGNPVAEIFVGLEDGTIRTISPRTGEAKTLVSGLGGAVDALEVGEVNGRPFPEVAAAVAGRALLFDGLTGAQIWQSEPLSPRAGTYDSLLLAQLDGDGLADLVVNMTIGIAAFFTAPAIELPFRDAFEVSSLRRWSRSHPAEP